MRCINNITLDLPEGWDERSEQARLAVEQGTRTVNEQSAVWREAKDALANCSDNKCWYCEVKQARSDNAVDHFRPKNSVAGTKPPHSGYWWLAFDASNLRYSCTYCNSRRKNPETGLTEGKGDEFPLLPDTPRAVNPGEEDNESPVLLDPCRAHDPGLLDFLDNGRPCARYPGHATRRLRAEESIRLYHLDHPDLIELRKVLSAQLIEKIKKADRLFDRCDTGDPAIDDAFDELICSLGDAMADCAELSTFARKVVSGYREREWVEELLRTA